MREFFSSNIREALQKITFIFANEIPSVEDLRNVASTTAMAMNFSVQEANKLTLLAEDIILNGEHLDLDEYIMDLD